MAKAHTARLEAGTAPRRRPPPRWSARGGARVCSIAAAPAPLQPRRRARGAPARLSAGAAVWARGTSRGAAARFAGRAPRPRGPMGRLGGRHQRSHARRGSKRRVAVRAPSTQPRAGARWRGAAEPRRPRPRRRPRRTADVARARRRRSQHQALVGAGARRGARAACAGGARRAPARRPCPRATMTRRARRASDGAEPRRPRGRRFIGGDARRLKLVADE